MFKVDPDTKALRIFLRNLLAGIGINSAIQLMLTSFHKLWPHLRNPLYKVV